MTMKTLERSQSPLLTPKLAYSNDGVPYCLNQVGKLSDPLDVYGYDCFGCEKFTNNECEYSNPKYQKIFSKYHTYILIRQEKI